MRPLLNHFAQSFYADFLLFFISIFALYISIVRKEKHSLLRLFPYYFISYIILLLLLYTHIIFFLNSRSNHIMLQIDSYSDYIFTLIEFIVFMHFFYNVIDNQRKKRIIILLSMLFLLLFAFNFISESILYNNINPNTVNRIYTIESSILLIPSLFYYFEIFKKPTTMNLMRESSFWVVTGIFFSMICSLPYCVIENYIRKNNSQLYPQLFSIFYIFYSLLFMMIIKAYLCEKISLKINV